MATNFMELKNAANEKASVLQVLINKSTSTVKEITDAEAALVEAVRKVNEQVVSDAVDLAKEGREQQVDQLLEALGVGFLDKYSVKKSFDKDAKFTKIEVVLATKKVYFPLNKIGVPEEFKKYLPNFTKMVNRAIGRSFTDDDAVNAIRTAALKAASKRKADAVGVTKNDSFFDLCNIDEDKDILSITSLKQALNFLLSLLLCEKAPAIRSKDIRMILSLGTKDSNYAEYADNKDKTAMSLIQKALYAILNGVEYKAKESTK